MDLFDMVQSEESVDERDYCRRCRKPLALCRCPMFVDDDDYDRELVGPIADQPPTDEELEARFLGEERAGIPSWSRSAATIAAALAALLASVEGERRAELASIEEESYKAARRRKLARVAAEQEVEAV